MRAPDNKDDRGRRDVGNDGEVKLAAVPTGAACDGDEAASCPAAATVSVTLTDSGPEETDGAVAAALRRRTGFARLYQCMPIREVFCATSLQVVAIAICESAALSRDGERASGSAGKYHESLASEARGEGQRRDPEAAV